MCGSCLGYGCRQITHLGEYLCLDVELYFVNSGQRTYPKGAVERQEAYECRILDIPITLNDQSRKYELVGVAEHTPGHYIAHCRSRNNLWDKSDNMNVRGTRKQLTEEQLNENRQFAFFFYVRC